jgi:hypothetical protein
VEEKEKPSTPAAFWDKREENPKGGCNVPN